MTVAVLIDQICNSKFNIQILQFTHTFYVRVLYNSYNTQQYFPKHPNCLIFIMELYCVLCAVRSEFLYYLQAYMKDLKTLQMVNWRYNFISDVGEIT